MSVPDLVGKKVVLVPMRLEEADLLVKWVNEPDQRGRWFGREASRAEVLERWPPVMFDDAYPQKGRAFRVDERRVPLGAVLYHALWGRPRNARLELVLAGGVGPEPGSDAVDALARYLFDALRAHDLWTEVPGDDSRDIAAFEGAGFQRAGATAEEGKAILRRVRPPAGTP